MQFTNCNVAKDGHLVLTFEVVDSKVPLFLVTGLFYFTLEIIKMSYHVVFSDASTDGKCPIVLLPGVMQSVLGRAVILWSSGDNT